MMLALGRSEWMLANQNVSSPLFATTVGGDRVLGLPLGLLTLAESGRRGIKEVPPMRVRKPGSSCVLLNGRAVGVLCIGDLTTGNICRHNCRFAAGSPRTRSDISSVWCMVLPWRWQFQTMSISS